MPKDPKYILVLNAGSSSLKYELFEILPKKELREVIKGNHDAIGLRHGKFRTHKKAIKKTIKKLRKEKIVPHLDCIKIVSHRVVHGGEKYKKRQVINDQVIKDIKKLSELAPLHNPINLEGILAAKKYLKKAKQIAVFDTAFYSTLPEKAYLYALPRVLYTGLGIRRYGFHGTSHKFVTQKTLELMSAKNPKIITVHLGSGCSITASVNGESVETSMGFTPLEGVPMGTRSGSIDPSIPLYLQKALKLKPSQVEEMLLKESGLLALSEISSDMRLIYEQYKKKKKKAVRAIELYSYQIARSIASMAAAMNGVDAITFTAGIGENAHYVRKEILKHIEFLGVKLDANKNRANKISIHKPSSKVKIFVIPTNESLQIAKESI